MGKALTSAEAFIKVTEGVLTLLRREFPERDVAISFASIDALLAGVNKEGIIRLVPLSWENMDEAKSRVGSRLALHYGIVVAEPVAGDGWDEALPAARLPFLIYDVLRFRPLPECPGVILTRISDAVFRDARALSRSGLFWGMLEAGYQMEIV